MAQCWQSLEQTLQLGAVLALVRQLCDRDCKDPAEVVQGEADLVLAGGVVVHQLFDRGCKDQAEVVQGGRTSCSR